MRLWSQLLVTVGCLLLPNIVQAQLIGPRSAANGFNSRAYGSNLGSFGNAGGFATGPGLSNGYANSMNFGSNVVGAYSRAPGLTNSGYAMGIQTGVFGNGFGGPGLASNVSPFGMATGFYPPNVAAGLFGSQLGIAPFGAAPFGMYGAAPGFVDLGAAFDYSALGLGGFAYPGMMPGAMMPGAMMPGAVMPGMMPGVDGSLDTASTASSTPRQPVRPRAVEGSVVNGSGTATSASQAQGSRLGDVRWSKFDDGIPRSTVTATRIQNRLNNVRTPDFTNIKVLMTGTTATLTGSVASSADEQLVIRMVGLEPGVLKVVSELKVP